MNARRARQSDFETLSRMAGETGFPYPNLEGPFIESCWVVADENDHPVMAVAAEKIVQLYLYPGSVKHPAARLAALRLLHEKMGDELRAKGYAEVNAFLPPAICERFGRRLRKTFGWAANWPSLSRSLYGSW